METEKSNTLYEILVGNCITKPSPESCVFLAASVVIFALILCFAFACYGISRSPDPTTFYETVLTLTQPIVTLNEDGEFVVRANP